MRVLVVGEFKQGKSQLVNAPGRRAVCPVDDDVATAVPTVVRHAERRRGRARPRDARRAARAHRGPGATSSPTYVCEAGNPGNRRRSPRRDRPPAQAPRAAGWCSSTPPASAAWARRTAPRRWRRCPPRTPCCWSPTPRRSTPRPELEFLAAAMQRVPERRVRRSPRPTSTRTGGASWSSTAGTSPPPGSAPTSFPVSSARPPAAVAHRRTPTQRRVRLPGADPLPARAGARRGPTSWTAARPAHDVLAVCRAARRRRCRPSWRHRRTPSAPPPLLAELTGRRPRADALKERSARWQITLNDGVGRPRRRHRLRPARPAAADQPARPRSCSTRPTRPQVWDQFAGWVHQEVASAASANFVWATRAGARAGRCSVARALRRGRRDRRCPTLRRGTRSHTPRR